MSSTPSTPPHKSSPPTDPTKTLLPSKTKRYTHAVEDYRAQPTSPSLRKGTPQSKDIPAIDLERPKQVSQHNDLSTPMGCQNKKLPVKKGVKLMPIIAPRPFVTISGPEFPSPFSKPRGDAEQPRAPGQTSSRDVSSQVTDISSSTEGSEESQKERSSLQKDAGDIDMDGC